MSSSKTYPSNVTVGILLRQIVDVTYPNRFDVTSRWPSVSYLLSSDPSRKLPTADFFTFVISRRQYSLRLILSSSSCPSLPKSDPFQIFKIDPPEVVNHFETEDIFLVTHSVLSEPVSSMKFIDFQRKTKIFDILVIANVISRRISRHVQKMRCTDPLRRTIPSIINAYLVKILFVIIRSSWIHEELILVICISIVTFLIAT